MEGTCGNPRVGLLTEAEQRLQRTATTAPSTSAIVLITHLARAVHCRVDPNQLGIERSPSKKRVYRSVQATCR